MSCLLSIIVPIKGSYEYVESIIRKIESIDSDDIEIVIQDISERNEAIVEFFSDLSVKRSKYFHISTKMTMTEFRVGYF